MPNLSRRLTQRRLIGRFVCRLCRRTDRAAGPTVPLDRLCRWTDCAAGPTVPHARGVA
jgi:hypothetical protein